MIIAVLILRKGAEVKRFIFIVSTVYDRYKNNVKRKLMFTKYDPPNNNIWTRV